MPSLLKMIAEMGLNIAPFQKGLDQAKAMAQTGGASIGQAFSGVINRYFGIAALTAFGASIVHRVSEIKNLAEQFGLTTDEVQQFGKAFENSGLQAEEAGIAIDHLNRSRREAVENSQDLRDAFASFGITVEQLNDAGTRTADIFRRIGIFLQEGQVTDKQRAALLELMGKNGARFAEAMKELDAARPALISEEEVKRIEEAEKKLRELRREIEKMIVLQASAVAKGDILGFLKEQFADTGEAFARGIRKIRQNAGAPGEFPPGPGAAQLPSRDFAAIKELPGDAERLRRENEGKRQKQLFQDGIAAKQRLATGKAQAEVEEKLSDIVFGKLRGDQQVQVLRKKQRDLEEEINDQKRQQVDLLFTEEIRQENIANLKVQQLEAEQKIIALQKQGAIGFEGFRKLAQAGGLNPASYSSPAITGNPGIDSLSKGMGQSIAVLTDIRNGLAGKKVILGR